MSGSIEESGRGQLRSAPSVKHRRTRGGNVFTKCKINRMKRSEKSNPKSNTENVQCASKSKLSALRRLCSTSPGREQYLGKHGILQAWAGQWCASPSLPLWPSSPLQTVPSSSGNFVFRSPRRPLRPQLPAHLPSLVRQQLHLSRLDQIPRILVVSGAGVAFRKLFQSFPSAMTLKFTEQVSS